MALIATLAPTTACGAGTSPLDLALECYERAIGAAGRETIHTMEVVALIEIADRDVLQFTFAKRPAKLRVEYLTAAARVVQVHDGEQAWGLVKSKGEPESVLPMPAELAAGLRDMALSALGDELGNARRRGWRIELLGGTGEDESTTFLVKEGAVERFRLALDPTTHLPAEKSFVEGGRRIGHRYARYQRIRGTLVPLETAVSVDGADVSTTTICSIRFNENIDDALFTNPEKGAPQTPNASSSMMASALRSRAGNPN